MSGDLFEEGTGMMQDGQPHTMDGEAIMDDGGDKALGAASGIPDAEASRRVC